jgi:hypothetical protein
MYSHRERAERRQIRGDLRRLAKEERGRQEAAVVEVVKGAQVNTTFDTRQLINLASLYFTLSSDWCPFATYPALKIAT